MYGARDVSISPLVPAGLVSLADAKAFIGVSGSAEDARITELISVATDLAERYCGTIFSQRTVTETLDTDDAHTTLVFRYSPVQSLTSITYNGAAKVTADFQLRPALGAVRRLENAGFEAGKWVIVYVGGYAPGSAPPMLSEAVKHLTKALYLAKGSPIGVRAEAVSEVGSVTYGSVSGASRNGVGVPVEVASLLASFVAEYAP